MEDSLPELPTLDSLGSQKPAPPASQPVPSKPVNSVPVSTIAAPANVPPPAAPSPPVVATAPAASVPQVAASAPAVPRPPPPPVFVPPPAQPAPPAVADKPATTVPERPAAPAIQPIQEAAREIVLRKPPSPSNPGTTRNPIPVVLEAPSLPPVKEQLRSLPVAPRRLLALDAFRGFIMMLLASSGFGIAGMASKEGSDIWDRLKVYVEHVQWSGCVPWDLIQPAFMFMVGMAMPFSYDKRRARGDSTVHLFDHAVFRSLLLILLGVFLASNVKDGHTNWQFTNVLAQIGLGYLALFAFWRAGTWAQIIGFIAILVGYGAWFAYYPLDPNFAYTFKDGGLQQTDLFTGFFAHWNPHTNAAAGFDRWFLNLFPRGDSAAFDIHPGGYQTLNFIPSIGTMLLGLWAGRYVRSDRSDGTKTLMLLLFGGLLVGAGYLVGENLCPVVKRLWTPSWVLLSGGFVVLMLAGFYAVIEWFNVRILGWPLAVLGMNSIFIYLAGQLSKGFITERLRLHLFPSLPKEWMSNYGPMVEACSVLGVIWLLCWWLYRQRAFLRI